MAYDIIKDGGFDEKLSLIENKSGGLGNENRIEYKNKEEGRNHMPFVRSYYKKSIEDALASQEEKSIHHIYFTIQESLIGQYGFQELKGEVIKSLYNSLRWAPIQFYITIGGYRIPIQVYIDETGSNISSMSWKLDIIRNSLEINKERGLDTFLKYRYDEKPLFFKMHAKIYNQNYEELLDTNKFYFPEQFHKIIENNIYIQNAMALLSKEKLENFKKDFEAQLYQEIIKAIGHTIDYDTSKRD